MKIQDNIQDKDSHDAENVKIDKGQVKELRATWKIKRKRKGYSLFGLLAYR